MLILDGANDKVQLVTGDAADMEVQVSWMHNNAGTVTPGGDPMASITTATTTDIVAAAGASQQRNVKNISIKNNHGSQSQTATVQETDGTNTVILWGPAEIAAGELLVFDETGRWTLYDTNGQEKAVSFPAATQADMEAATSLLTTVTPGRQHYHPGSSKFWVVFTGNSTTILGSYNMTSITDGTTEATVTIATDFSGANTWCCNANAEGTTSSAVANARVPTIRSQAAGSVIVWCADLAATPVIQDPTRWHVSGLGDHA